jgi:hypothetical protein
LRAVPSLLKDGTEQIEGAIGRNITAVKQLAELTRTSFGPNGTVPFSVATADAGRCPSHIPHSPFDSIL